MAGSPLLAPTLPTPGCRLPGAPPAVPGAGFAVPQAPVFTGFTSRPHTPRRTRAPHAARGGTSAFSPRRGPGLALGALGGPVNPSLPRLPWQAGVGATGSRRRCERDERGGCAAPLRVRTSPALCLGGSGAASWATGRPRAAASSGAAPVHAAPPSAVGPETRSSGQEAGGESSLQADLRAVERPLLP